MKRGTLLGIVLAAGTAALSALAQTAASGKDSKGIDMGACQEMMAGGSMAKDHGGMTGKDRMGMGRGHMGMMGQGGMGMMGQDRMGMMGKDHGITPEECREMMEKHDMGMSGKGAAKTAQLTQHQGSGTVKKIDAAAGKITLEHDAIKSLGWPKMTMGFSVKDRKQLEGLKPGQAVSFSFAQQGSDYVISTIK